MEKAMHKVLYEFPEPPTNLIKGPVFRDVPGIFRQRKGMFTLTYVTRHEGRVVTEELQFIEPMAYAYYSLFTVPSDASTAYGKVVEIAGSSLLREIKSRIESRPSGISTSELRHLAVLFDDGPYYDFICEGFAHVRRTEDPTQHLERKESV